MLKFIILSLISCVAFASPIEFVVTTAPGGPVDTTTRMLVAELEKNTNLNFVVINKPGAGHNVGYKYIDETDKPTIFVSSNTIITNKDREGYPVNITKNIEPIFYLGDFSNILFVSKKSNINSLNDLKKLSKTRDINFGHGGVGTYSHKSMSKICSSTIKCLEVPYKSGSFGMIDLLSGVIDAYSLASFGSEQWMENDALRPIVIFSKTKHELFKVNTLPDNVRNLEIKNWLMLFGKNISDDDKKVIVNTLKKLEDKYYTKMGLWYVYKEPKTIWTKSIEE